MSAATAAEVACHDGVERQDLSRTYLAHHELESVIVIIITYYEVIGGMQDLLARHDVILKKVFAWYASLPSLAGQASWEQFRHNQKGMLAGHLILLLTDFKVCPLLWICHRFFQTETLMQLSCLLA
jgi:hypothetical protein